MEGVEVRRSDWMTALKINLRKLRIGVRSIVRQLEVELKWNLTHQRPKNPLPHGDRYLTNGDSLQ